MEAPRGHVAAGDAGNMPLTLGRMHIQLDSNISCNIWVVQCCETLKHKLSRLLFPTERLYSWWCFKAGLSCGELGIA